MLIGTGTTRQFECIIVTSPFRNDNVIKKCMKVQILTDDDHLSLQTTFLY
jgi:hypothetical protein